MTFADSGFHAISLSFGLRLSGEPVHSKIMKSQPATVEIPLEVLESVDTLDELEDWLTANNPRTRS